MKYINRFILLLIITGLQLSACAPASTEEEEIKAAQIEPIEGTDLNRVILTEEGAERIGLEMGQVLEDQVARKQVVTGEIVASPAATTVVTAPVSGVVLPPSNASIPVTGTELSTGQTVFRLSTGLVSAEAQPSVELGIPKETVLLRLLVTPGQFVEAGQPLFKVADLGQVWVRVPLNQSDRDRVERSKQALIQPVESNGDLVSWTADPVKDNELKASDELEDVDGELYYKVENKDHDLALGQRVLVELSLLESTASQKVVPYNAVIFGQHGETWVFVNPEPLTFVRQPIVIDYIEGDRAILLEGPDAGTAIVTVGAEELYGSEFEFAEE